MSAATPDNHKPHVLIATDGSDFAIEAARRAVGLVSPSSRLTVLTVVPYVPVVAALSGPGGPSAVLFARRHDDRGWGELLVERDGASSRVVEHQCGRTDLQLVKTTGSSEKPFDPKRLELEQAQLKQEFLEFKQSLLRLAQNLELSTKPENKEKAAMLRQALEQAAQKGVDAKFNKLIETMRSPKVISDNACSVALSPVSVQKLANAA